MSWGHAGSGRLPPGASTVEITLAPTDGGTLVTVVHHGLPEPDAAQHAVGWSHFLARLVEAGAGGDPGPDPWARQMRIRAAEPGDRAQLEGFLERWHSLRVARLGTIERPLDHTMLVAERDGRLAGVLTYVVRGDECEILTLHADERRKGVGSALIAEVARIARRVGCDRLWLLTTNDNVDALRFYQRRGFRLAALHPGAVDDSRTRLKPEIPEVGDHGIPIRDELVLEMGIGGGSGG